MLRAAISGALVAHIPLGNHKETKDFHSPTVSRRLVPRARSVKSYPAHKWHTEPYHPESFRPGSGKIHDFLISTFIATNPEPPTLVLECDFFVQFWRTRKGPNQFADAMRDAE